VIIGPSAFRIVFLILLSLSFFTTSTFAWGCKGHQTAALIAERHLTPEARQYLHTLLNDNPVDPQLKRYCGAFAGSLLADASTWPDDVRGARNNGPWHYIDIPRRAPHRPLADYCGDSGCIAQAIAEQLAILKDPRADSRQRAEALRYIIHFVGDLHMPLHASDNNDEGGNCAPVDYLGAAPQKHNHSYSPNLHSIWDTSILERDMNGTDPQHFADELDRKFHGSSASWQRAGIHVDAWAWESHDLAERFAYGKLHPNDPVEAHVIVHSCSDDNNVGERLRQMHFAADEKYQRAAARVVEKRVAQAGIRLAMILNDAVRVAQKAQ
jgi:hypothetical protein